MTERPILFSSPMVQALLSGSKTQTRRIVKVDHGDATFLTYLRRPLYANNGPEVLRAVFARHTSFAGSEEVTSTYGDRGDRLWVREAWARTRVFPDTEMVVYRTGDNRTDYGGPWKPGIHMFRRDSRITLENTDVRVERLQDISEADALAEGIVQLLDGGFGLPAGEHYHAADPRISYWSLWDAINGPGSAESNPWVWRVSFRRLP